eukprot:308483-Karenia_brevis.AAC.1
MLSSERTDANVSKSKSKPSSRQIRAAGKRKQQLRIQSLLGQVMTLQDQVNLMKLIIVDQQSDIDFIEGKLEGFQFSKSTASPASPELFDSFDNQQSDIDFNEGKLEGLQFSKPTEQQQCRPLPFGHAPPELFD